MFTKLGAIEALQVDMNIYFGKNLQFFYFDLFYFHHSYV